jgi:uncharacterized membrane protein
MTKGRLEAFSDGVIAILITIMVLELKVPHGSDVASLRPLLPIALAYVLSFVYVGIYWVNHHHLLHATERITGGVLWANLHLLFWLSLTPVATAWLGENYREPLPNALYGTVLLAAGCAYSILQATILRAGGPDSRLAKMLGRDFKGKISPILYLIAVPIAFLLPWLSIAIYVSVALMWLVPDTRIEKNLNHQAHG